MASNCEVATLVVVELPRLLTRNLVAVQQDTLRVSACNFFARKPDVGVCSRLAESSASEHESAAGTKRKLTPSSRPICNPMPKIGAGDCSKDARHAVQVYGSAYTTPRAPSDRPVSRCTEFGYQLVRDSVLLTAVKNNDPAFHPRAADVGNRNLQLEMTGVAGWKLSFRE